MTHDPTVEHLPLKALDLSVLLVLSEGDAYGYAIVKRIAERDGGQITLAPSNLYQVLDRMMARGLVTRVPSPEGAEDESGRRYFGVTGLGRRVLRAELDRLAGLMDAARRLEIAP